MMTDYQEKKGAGVRFRLRPPNYTLQVAVDGKPRLPRSSRVGTGGPASGVCTHGFFISKTFSAWAVGFSDVLAITRLGKIPGDQRTRTSGCSFAPARCR